MTIAVKEKSLTEFMNEYGSVIADKVVKEYGPLHNPFERSEIDIKLERKLQKLKRKLLPIQKETALAAYKHFKKQRVMDIVGEMGVGKTITAISIAYITDAKRIVVMCPPHLVRKWCREIEETVPEAKVYNLNSKTALTHLIRLYNTKHIRSDIPEWYVIGRERAKLDEPWMPVIKRYAYYRGEKVFGDFCPDCGSSIDIEVVGNFKRKRSYCNNCGSPLYTYYRKYNRYALCKFINKRLKRVFDLFIADEVHELKGGNTAQGNAFGMIASAARKILTLTGTYSGGYADNIFYLLYRTRAKDIKKENIDFSEVGKWIDLYGAQEIHVKENNEDNTEDHKVSKGSSKTKQYTKILPVISPTVIGRHVIDRAVFIRLADVAEHLPDYNETVISLQMDDELKNAYEVLENELTSILSGDSNFIPLGAYATILQALLQYPDSCYEDREISYTIYQEREKIRETLLAPQVYCNDELSPKEKEMVKIIKENIRENRKCLVYLEYTGTKDISSRLVSILEKEGIRVKVLKSSVGTDKREAWIERNAPDIDVLITNPEVVKTGLDLFDFPTVIFYQTGYKIYTLRQASRRSWRIGQRKDVRVYFLVYKKTAQDKALSLVASKLMTALMLEGEVSDSGLQQIATGDSMVKELAKAITGEVKIDDAENVWKTLRKKELETELKMVDNAQKEVLQVNKEEEVNAVEDRILYIHHTKGQKKNVLKIQVKVDELDKILKEKGLENEALQIALF